jgi:hypothetical protein
MVVAELLPAPTRVEEVCLLIASPLQLHPVSADWLEPC